MRAIALVTPLLVLGLLPVLGRMEAWSTGERARPRLNNPRPRRTDRHRMTHTAKDTPDLDPGPLPRDPPPPPGYTDPLEGRPVLEGLVEAPAEDAGDRRTPGTGSG